MDISSSCKRSNHDFCRCSAGFCECKCHNKNKRNIKKSICIISYIYPRKNRFKRHYRGIFVHLQASELSKYYKVDVLTTGYNRMKKEERLDNVNIHRLLLKDDIDIKRYGLIFALKILKKLYKSNFDIIHQHFAGISTIFIGLYCKLFKKPFILTSHGTDWELPKKNIFKNFLIKLALFFPDKIICVSEAVKSYLSYNTNLTKLIVIYNGINITQPSIPSQGFKRKLGLNNKKIILSVGIHKKKGIDVIIKAIPKLVKKFPDLIYIIIGDNEEKNNLEKLTKELSLQKYVRFEGIKQFKELSNYYNICDVFVLMSRTLMENGEITAIESFGISYIEASYFGKPVIGGISGGTSEIIKYGKNGFLVKNEKELIEKLELLLKNKKLREKFGKYGRKWVIDNFLLSDKVKEISHIYEQEMLKY